MRAAAVVDSEEETSNVKGFLAEHEDTLVKLARGTGHILGFANPIATSFKTPFPCTVEWSTAQMFDGTPEVQQCVKVP